MACSVPRASRSRQAGPSHSDKWEKKTRKKRDATPVLPAEGTTRRPARRATVDKKPAPTRPEPGKWCEIHQTDWHDLTECRSVKGVVERHQKEREERRRGGDDKAAPENQELGFQEPEHTISFIDGGAYTPSSRRCVKTIRREVCSATPRAAATRPLKWSETPSLCPPKPAAPSPAPSSCTRPWPPPARARRTPGGSGTLFVQIPTCRRRLRPHEGGRDGRRPV